LFLEALKFGDHDDDDDDDDDDDKGNCSIGVLMSGSEKLIQATKCWSTFIWILWLQTASQNSILMLSSHLFLIRANSRFFQKI
jgi:hypothetical protein